MPTRALSYTIESKLISGAWVGCVITTCSVCKQAIEVRWRGNNNPHHIAKHLAHLGWRFSPYRASSNKCPTCNKPIMLAPPSNPDPINDAINPSYPLAKNLRRLMDKYSFTEGTLAAESGVSLSAIKLMLSGSLETHYQLPDIAKTLRASVEELTPVKPPRVLSAVIFPSSFKETGRLQPATPAPPPPKPPETPIAARPVRQPRPLITPASGIAKAFFGDNPGVGLRDMRTAKGLSQGALAKQIATHDVPWKAGSIQSMLSMIERNQAGPMKFRDRLLAIAAAILEDTKPSKKIAKTKPAPKVQLPAVVAKPKASVPAVPNGLEVELRQAINDLAAIRELFNETVSKIENIQTKLLDKAAAKPREKKPTVRINERGNHLQMVGGMWFYRRHVPRDAQPVFGVTEVKSNLKTDNLSEALKRKRPYERAFEKKLAEVRP